MPEAVQKIGNTSLFTPRLTQQLTIPFLPLATPVKALAQLSQDSTPSKAEA
jgi:hypothetical protein